MDSDLTLSTVVANLTIVFAVHCVWPACHIIRALLAPGNVQLALDTVLIQCGEILGMSAPVDTRVLGVREFHQKHSRS